MLHSTHTHDKVLETVENKLQYGADNAKDSSRTNKMHIHYNKTSYMILSTSNKFSNPNRVQYKNRWKPDKKRPMSKTSRRTYR